jgi:AcrR family transcriptional regulator
MALRHASTGSNGAGRRPGDSRSHVTSALTRLVPTGQVSLRTGGSRKEGTRAALSAAALRLFALQGYDATTVDQIAAAAGVGQRTFFHHFRSKEGVLFAGYDERFEDATTAFRSGSSGGSLWDGLRAAGLALVDAIEAQRELFLVRNRLYAATPALRASMLRLNEAWINNLASEIGECLRVDPLVTVGPRLIASLASSANRIAIDLWSLSDGEVSLRELAEEALEVIRPSVDEFWRACNQSRHGEEGHG